MSTPLFEELLPEIRTLIKKGNFIRINALLRHSGYTTLCGEKLAELAPREIGFLIERKAAERKVAALQKELASVDETSYTKTQLNKMKKAELVDLLLK